MVQVFIYHNACAVTYSAAATCARAASFHKYFLGYTVFEYLESRVGKERAKRAKKTDLSANIMSRGGDVARVYIGDLGSGGSKPELEREFERYGPLKSVWVARNPPGME